MYKHFVLFAIFAAVRGGILQPALRYETPIIAAAPSALRVDIPPTSRLEHLSPVVSTSYGYSTVPLKHEVVAPAVRVAAAPVAIAAPAPLAIAAPALKVAIPAPTIHVETPAISRIEHLAPAVASSYKTEVITPPKVHVTHTPAVARIDHFAPTVKAELLTAPAIAHVAPVVRSEVIAAPAPIAIAQPALRLETPAIAKVEHLAPAFTSHLRSELISTPAITNIGHLAPAIRSEFVSSPSISYLSSPVVKSHAFVEPTLRLASATPLAFDHSLGLKHLTYAL